MAESTTQTPRLQIRKSGHGVSSFSITPELDGANGRSGHGNYNERSFLWQLETLKQFGLGH